MTYYFPVIALPDEGKNGHEEEKEEVGMMEITMTSKWMMKSGTYSG